MVVQRGLAPRARELLANSSALEEAVLGEQRRLDLGECRVLRGVLALWDSCPPATLYGGSQIVTVRVRMAAALGVNFPHCPGKSTPGALQRPTHPDFVTGPQDVDGPGERTREPADGSVVLAKGHVCAGPWRRAGQGVCVCVCTLCCEHLRALVAMRSGLAFLSLHCFTYKMGTVAFAVGPGGCSETWGAVLPRTQMALVSRCLPLTVCV